MIGVRVDTRAADQLLGRAQQVLDDDTTMRRFAAQLLVEHEEHVFATADDGRWARLDPATERAKGNGRVLVDTGALLNQLTDESRVAFSGDTATLAPRGDVAGYLAAGARGMPARDPMPAPDRDETRTWAFELLDLVVGRRGR